MNEFTHRLTVSQLSALSAKPEKKFKHVLVINYILYADLILLITIFFFVNRYVLFISIWIKT